MIRAGFKTQKVTRSASEGIDNSSVTSPALTLWNLPTVLFHGDEAADGEDEFFEASLEGDPAGVAVAFAQQEAAESGEVAEEIADGGQLLFAKLTEHFRPELRDHLYCGKVGVSDRNRLELQQAHRQHAGEARDRFESIGFHVLSRLQSAARLDRLVIFLDQPAAFVVFEDLPRFVEVGHEQ